MKGIVQKITDDSFQIGKHTLNGKMATVLCEDGEEISLRVFAGYPNPNHAYCYDNVVPHNDWIREGMTVGVSRDFDGPYLRKEGY